MNFAQAARGNLNREGMLRKVDSQSEIELGRHLNATERDMLMSRVPIDAIVRCIDKVCNWFNPSIYINFTTFSMVLVHLSSYSFFAKGPI